ncbi:protein kinase, partial [Myxococcota bacterium]
MANDAGLALAGGDTNPPGEWRGTSRYTLVQRIGRGGMGVVYEAFDRARGRTVALKTLVHFTPAALYCLKQEFRTLADIQHPNLVRLYELVVEDSGRAFFTMELARGQDFHTYTLRDSARPARLATAEVTRIEKEGEALVSSNRMSFAPDGTTLKVPAPGGPPRTHLADLHRLRLALRQLVQGVHALHAAGKLHRDLKPSNVLVTEEGRVVLLDFGLATDIASATGDPLVAEVVGTPEYIAPEQVHAELPMPASDWYSVGVMLYQALVGRPPFTGSVMDVVKAKTTATAPPPSASVEQVPSDLDLLCCALLERDPDRRPTGSTLMRYLGADGSLRPSLKCSVSRSSGLSLVGRKAHLCLLEGLFQLVREGSSVTVHVSGASGMGKSTLVQYFAHGLAMRGEAVVLDGRVHEHESVPYKAIDGVVDALSRHLKRRQDRNEPLALPRHIDALACLFPALRRVELIAAATEKTEKSPTDPLHTRRLAFGALREILADMARQRPVVLHLDDVQWGDVD